MKKKQDKYKRIAHLKNISEEFVIKLIRFSIKKHFYKRKRNIVHLKNIICEGKLIFRQLVANFADFEKNE